MALATADEAGRHWATPVWNVGQSDAGGGATGISFDEVLVEHPQHRRRAVAADAPHEEAGRFRADLVDGLRHDRDPRRVLTPVQSASSNATSERSCGMRARAHGRRERPPAR